MSFLLRVKLVLTEDTGPALGRARSSLVLFGLFIINQDFTILAIAMRFVLGGPYESEDVLGLVEDRVHLFERSISSLRIEEIDDRDDEGVTRDSVSIKTTA